MSPLRTECFDIFSPPPGAREVMTQVERLSSRDTKIALRSVRMAACSSGRGQRACMVAPEWVVQHPHSARERGPPIAPMGSVPLDPGLCAGAGEADLTSSASLHQSNGSWRVDETYVKVKGRWTYLYRAVDSRSQTIDFLLSAKRDAAAAQRFFRKALGQPHTGNPRTITVDKNAAYPAAVTALKRDRELWRFSRLRQVKYLNNIVEQDHPRIKRLVRPGLGFGSLPTARRTLAGYEGMAMIRKGQVRNIGGGDMRAQAAFVAGLFGVAA